MEGIIAAVLNFFSTALPQILSGKREPHELNRKYEELRVEIATALVKYADCYHNPVDLANMPGHKLPPKYETAAVELRNLASIAYAFAATLPEKEKKQPIAKSEMADVSRCLFGLSNSMQTPYDCGPSLEDLRNTLRYENDIKRILKLSTDSNSQKTGRCKWSLRITRKK